MTEIPVFDVAALRQAAEIPWPTDFRTQTRYWVQMGSDLAAAADYIDELLALLEERKR